MTYSHSSSEALTIDGFTIFPVLIVGDIVSERVRSDTTTANLTARMGLPRGMQAEVRGRDAFGAGETQIPFGSGFDAISASLTGVSVLDPVVFFGALSYTKSRRTEVEGFDVPGSYINTGTLSIGVSRVLMSGTSLDGSLIIGLSEESPDLQLAFSMPFRSWWSVLARARLASAAA